MSALITCTLHLMTISIRKWSSTHTHTHIHTLTHKIVLFFLAQFPPLFQLEFKWRMKVPNIIESKTSAVSLNFLTLLEARCSAGLPPQLTLNEWLLTRRGPTELLWWLTSAWRRRTEPASLCQWFLYKLVYWCNWSDSRWPWNWLALNQLYY